MNAIVRIDAKPGGKRFQGVWLELPDGVRYLIDYRAHELWTWFADREVVVTGETYTKDPREQQVNAQHYRVNTMEAAKPERGRAPYLSIGPERAMRGRLFQLGYPDGSKRGGSTRLVFATDEASSSTTGTQTSADGATGDGRTYEIANPPQRERLGNVTVRARVLEPDMSYVARTNGPDLWLIDVADLED